MKTLKWFFKSEEFYDSIKYWLFSILLFLCINVDSVFASSNLIYVNTSDGNKIYQKSALDTSNGSPINSITSYDIASSPDWLSIIYRGTNWRLYKKSALDSSTGSEITSESIQFPKYTLDWQYIIYSISSWLKKKSAFDNSNGTLISTWWVNGVYAFSPDGANLAYIRSNDWNKLYIKNINDTSLWSPTGFSSPGFDWILASSLDWLYVYYVKSNKIYKKTWGGTDIGNPITVTGYTDKRMSIYFSSDGNYLYYINVNDWSKLYVKNANDVSDWSPITSNSVNSFSPIWTSVQIESCTDWIKNQDETAIDFWWVCGTRRLCHDERIYSDDYTYQDSDWYYTGSLLNSSNKQYNWALDSYLFSFWYPFGIALNLKWDITQETGILWGVYPHDFFNSSTGQIIASGTGFFWNNPPYIEVLTYGNTSYGTLKPVYTSGSYDYSVFQNGWFNYFSLSGSSNNHFTVKYDPIVQDEDLKETTTRDVDLPWVYSMNQKIVLPNATRRIAIYLEQPWVYNVDSVHIGSAYKSFSTGSVCQTFTDADIINAWGSWTLDGVAISNDLKDYIAKTDAASKWKINNPLLNGLLGLIDSFLKDVWLDTIFSIQKQFIPTLPNTTVVVPMINFPHSFSSGSITFSSQNIDFSTSSLHTIVKVFQNSNSDSAEKNWHWMVVWCLSVMWLFFSVLLMFVFLWVPLLVVNLIQDVLDHFLPWFSSAENVSGNIWTFVFQFSWIFYFASIILSTWAIVNAFNPIIILVKQDILAIFSFLALHFWVYPDFQLYANILVTALNVGVPILMVAVIAQRNWHLS